MKKINIYLNKSFAIRDTIPQQNLITESNSYLMKYILLFIILFISFSNVYGQSITWQRVIPTSRSFAFKSQQTRDGGYITSGCAYVNNILTTRLVKQNKFGDTTWTKLIRPGNGFWIENTTDAGFIIADWGGLIKTDSLGNVQWDKEYENPYGVQVRFVKPLSDNGYIAGMNWSLSNLNYKMKLVKLDSNGETQWEKMYQGPGTEGLSEVILVGNNGYLIAGGTTVPWGPSDIYLIRTNLSGDTLWTKTIGYPNYDDVCYSLQLTPDNGYILAGYSESFSNGQKKETYIVKTDSLGNKQWEKHYSASATGNFDITNAIRRVNYGYVIAGLSDTLNLGGGNYWGKVRFLDFNGNILREHTYLGIPPGGTSFQSIELTIDNGFIVSGSASSVGAHEYIFIVKTDSLGFSEPLGIIKNNYNITSNYILYQNYPNPFNPNTMISYELKDESTVTLTIFDILGSEIVKNNLGNKIPGRYIFNFNANDYNLSSGIYFYIINFRSKYSFQNIYLSKYMIYLK